MTPRRLWRANYHAYLRSAHWAELRAKVMRNAGYRCEACRGRKFLQAHHMSYGSLYDRTADDLMCLCKACHKKLHRRLRARGETLAQFNRLGTVRALR